MVEIDYSDIGSYLLSIAKRIAALEVTMEEMDETLTERGEKVNSTARAFQDDVKDLQEDLAEVRKNISSASAMMHLLIQDFKKVTRKSSLDRLKRKVEDWNPEKLATHRDLHRWLSK